METSHINAYIPLYISSIVAFGDSANFGPSFLPTKAAILCCNLSYKSKSNPSALNYGMLLVITDVNAITHWLGMHKFYSFEPRAKP